VIDGLVGEDSSHWILGVQWYPEKSFS